jgi:hypothetical protein
MKKVFSNTLECIHKFAERTQSNGRANSVFFEQTDFLYSHGRHYELARFIELKTGETVILINDTGYSVSTAKHIRYAIQATRQYKQYFTTDCDLAKVRNFILCQYDKFLKARKPEIYLNAILDKFSKFHEFPLNQNHPNQKKDIRYKEIKKIVDSLKSPEMLANAKEAAKKAAELKAKKEAAKLKKDIADFYAYELDYIRANEDFLRVSQNGDLVETSQGVKVSLIDARILYAAIVAKRDIRGHKIGNYTVTSINGHLKVGCHSINIESMHKVGKQISK